jgi:hypothetical protein
MGRLAALALVALVLAGCGGSGGDAGADPASALPPAAVYVEAVVNPEGAQEEKLRALAAKVLRTDEPGAKIVELLEEGGDGDTDFDRDVKPWLGRRAGIAVTEFSGEEPAYVAAVATSDSGAAADVLERLGERDGSKRRSHGGVDYWLDDEGYYTAVKGDFVLISGSERALRRTIDLEDGHTLADAQRFKDAVAPLPAPREGTLFLDVKGIVEETVPQGGLERQLIGALAGFVPPTAAAVLAEPDQLAVETRIRPDEAQRNLFGAFLPGLGYLSAVDLVGELPHDAWLALGVADAGEVVRTTVGAVGGPLGAAAIAGQLERDYGISLERDVYSWIGDLALYVRGTTPGAVSGAVVIEATDVARARRALLRLVVALQVQAQARVRPVALGGAAPAFEITTPGAEDRAYVALGDSRVVLGLGRDTTEAALDPDTPLRDAPLYDRGAGVLDGLEPALLVDVPAVLGLAEAEPQDEGFERAKPFLETLSVFAGGGRRDGDRVRSRLAVGVK